MRVKFLLSVDWWFRRSVTPSWTKPAGNGPVLWYQNQLNFLSCLCLSTNSQSGLHVSHLNSLPCQAPSPRALLQMTQCRAVAVPARAGSMLGALVASLRLRCVYSWVHFQLLSSSRTIQHCYLQDQVTSWPLKCQHHLYNVPLNCSREHTNPMHVVHVQTFLR